MTAGLLLRFLSAALLTVSALVDSELTAVRYAVLAVFVWLLADSAERAR